MQPTALSTASKKREECIIMACAVAHTLRTSRFESETRERCEQASWQSRLVLVG